MKSRNLLQMMLALLSLGCQACKTGSESAEPSTVPTDAPPVGDASSGASRTDSTSTEPLPGSWAPDVRSPSEDGSATPISGGSSTSGMGSRQLAGLGDVEVLDINHALWGADLPNSVKGISVAWDPANRVLYTASITNPWLMISRPEDGHPHHAIDLQVSGSHTNRMVVDETRRRLFWVAGTTEQIRVVDLDSQTLLHRHDPGTRTRGYPVQGIALDTASGWLWVVNKEHKRVKGYSPDLSQTATISGLTDPVAISGTPGGDSLFIIESLSKQEGRLVHYRPSTRALDEVKRFEGRGRPPRYVTATADGNVVVATRGLLALEPSGNELWKTPLPHPAVGLESLGDVVVTLVSSSDAPAKARNQPGFTASPEDQVVVVNARTGARKSEAKLRFEARRLTIDEAGRRAFVGNGGDGSVSIVGLDQPGVPRLIDVANAAEGTVVDPKSGRRFVLNRLGGSEIYGWDSQGLARFASLPWPFELALDSTRRQLIAVSYYEARVYRWDLDSSKPLPSIDLGIPKGTGDTLGDISYDPNSGSLAVVLPQEGWVALANIDSGRTTWTRQMESMQVGDHAGPGRGLVAIGAGRVFIVGGKPAQRTALSLSTGAIEEQTSTGGSGKKDRSAYRLNSLYFDTAGQRLFSGAQVLDPDSLAARSSLSNLDKVFYADSRQVLAMDVDGSTEYLVRLSPDSLEETGRWAITQSEVIRTEATYDPKRNEVLISDLPNAEVMVIPLP